MNGDEARRFGEKSLADVQVTDLNSVRRYHHYNNKKHTQHESIFLTREIRYSNPSV